MKKFNFLSILPFHFFLKRTTLILTLTILFTTNIQAQWSVIHDTIVGETTNDFSGTSVDLSGDGKKR